MNAIHPSVRATELIESMRHATEAMRRRAIKELVGIGQAAVPILVKALGDADSDVCRQAVRLLCVIGPDAAAAPALVKALGHADSDVRRFAALTLGTMGPDAAAVPALVKALGDYAPDVQEQAIVALVTIGSPAVSVLVDALDVDNKRVRRGAVRGAGKDCSASSVRSGEGAGR